MQMLFCMPPSPCVPDTLQDTLHAIQCGELSGMYLAACGTWVHATDTACMGRPERLVAVTDVHPARVYVEASRGVAGLPVNAAAKDLLGIHVRGPVCVLAPPKKETKKETKKEDVVRVVRPIPVPAYFVDDGVLGAREP